MSKPRARKTRATTHETPTGTQADYDAFLPGAKKVPASEVIVMRADPQLALHNVQIGVASVLEHAGAASKLPGTNTDELASLGRLALAVVFASTQLSRPAATLELKEDIARCNVLRALLLQSAHTLALAGLLPMADVVEIRKGHGKLDAARDLGALVALFAKHSARVHGKHPVTAAELHEAGELGASLLTVLKPGRAKKSRKPAGGMDERDRLWTLLVKGHDRLWRAGAYLFGRDAVEAKVPALRASKRAPKKIPAPKPPVPIAA